MNDSTAAVGAEPRILVLNGPNLNMLGVRAPEIYGTQTLGDIEQLVRSTAAAQGFETEFLQSNHEGVLIDAIQAARQSAVALIINPGAFSHYSLAIHDALESVRPLLTVEVHLSNIHKREQFRHHSYVSRQADVVIAGAGSHGYVMAVDYIARARAADHASGT
ncbi:type II 3-dehydroquinate dehydratase [Herbiconiux liukaitaii]|uniref:type II 3-dehydroquinate dehydratase n=1 Tax=Herbiconiux liukaitaii TaxID=3342799 RepID=UPI0035B9386A